MARPIKETPILYGKAARKFEEEMQRVENMTREERMANRKKQKKDVLQFKKTTEVQASAQKLWIISRCFYSKVQVTQHFVS